MAAASRAFGSLRRLGVAGELFTVGLLAQIGSLALMDVYGRVAKLLLDLSEQEGDLRLIRRKVTKQDMAKMVGASREMVSRVMRDLEASNYIRIEDGRIVLTGD